MTVTHQPAVSFSSCWNTLLGSEEGYELAIADFTEFVLPHLSRDNQLVIAQAIKNELDRAHSLLNADRDRLVQHCTEVCPLEGIEYLDLLANIDNNTELISRLESMMTAFSSQKRASTSNPTVPSWVSNARREF